MKIIEYKVVRNNDRKPQLMNVADYNFNKDFKYKLYYGKVNNLGYIVAEDEFEVR